MTCRQHEQVNATPHACMQGGCLCCRNTPHLASCVRKAHSTTRAGSSTLAAVFCCASAAACVTASANSEKATMCTMCVRYRPISCGLSASTPAHSCDMSATDSRTPPPVSAAGSSWHTTWSRSVLCQHSSRKQGCSVSACKCCNEPQATCVDAAALRGNLQQQQQQSSSHSRVCKERRAAHQLRQLLRRAARQPPAAGCQGPQQPQHAEQASHSIIRIPSLCASCGS